MALSLDYSSFYAYELILKIMIDGPDDMCYSEDYTHSFIINYGQPPSTNGPCGTHHNQISFLGDGQCNGQSISSVVSVGSGLYNLHLCRFNYVSTHNVM